MLSRLPLDAIPPVAVLLPLVAAPLSVVLGRRGRGRARRILLGTTCALDVVLVALLIPGVLRGEVYEVNLFRMTPTIWMHMRVDALGALFSISVAVLWFLALVYSWGYMADEHRLGRYYLFLVLALAWTLGLGFAGNLLSFLVFYELFSILTYPLVVHEETPEAMAAGLKYIIYILIGGGLVLLAIMSTYFLAGRVEFGAGSFFSLTGHSHSALIAVFWCFVAGFGVKGALVPLHGWVPDAHPAAPAPFSALLSGVMVAAGSFGIMRVLFDVFGVALLRHLGVAPILTVFAAVTVVFGAMLAVPQDDLKRRLAFSTISQMGYVVLGASLLGTQATTGAFVHIANHAFMKGTLFLCAGILIKRAGLRHVSQMRGIAKKYPLTIAAFTVTTLAMIGTPPLSGFISKWYLGLGMLQAEQPLYLVVLLGGALLAAVYLLPVVYVAYFKKPVRRVDSEGEVDQGREAPWTMLGPTLAATAVTVVLGVFAWVPGLPLSLAKLAAETLV